MPVTDAISTALVVEQRPVSLRPATPPPVTRTRTAIRIDMALPAALVLFFLAGCLMAPMVGLQHDELLFADSVLRPDFTWWHVSAAHFTLPMMMNSYLGALKGWVFAPIFAAFGYRVATIRIPALLLACVTILLVYRLLREIAGRGAALMGAWLLATDATFLITATFDWGPVVLQNLLLVGGFFCLVRSEQRRSAWPSDWRCGTRRSFSGIFRQWQ